jgi:demethylmenaquinone methyltransferase/2-methoxy-6-polyprenyl-1,4-benzoquinol methylase
MDDILQDQISYYRARAPEYDQWFLRQDRYDHGEAFNGRWFAQVDRLRRALDLFAPQGQVLELACGTGLWTQRLVRHASQVTAVDASPEVIAINQERLRSAKVAYLQADLFSWRPDRRYDVVFFSFWLSHVPPSRFADFWELVRAALKTPGRVFFIDSLYEPTTTARDHLLNPPTSILQDRKLNDGRSFRIVKVYYEPAPLQEKLAGMGWDVQVQRTENYFLYGSGTVRRPAREKFL